MKVLYIEDNITALKKANRLISSLGHTFLAAPTAKEGLEQLQSAPDLILVDMELPDSRGIPLIRKIHQQVPDIPIIAISGFAALGERDQCLEAGSVAYLSKPYDIKDLVDLVSHFSPSQPAES